MIHKTYQEGGEMIDTGKYIDEAMNLYLKELPEDSETAKAIRRGAALTEISQAAENEGLHYISASIFMAEEERFAQPGVDLDAALDVTLDGLAAGNHDQCPYPGAREGADGSDHRLHDTGWGRGGAAKPNEGHLLE